jgi:hypothetical protein
MKKFLFVVITILIAVNLGAQINAVFKEVSGKVEVNDPKKGWIPATVGMAVNKGIMISTGFKAKATVALGDTLVIVNQLTRMRLDELVEKEGTVNTELYLDVGKVTAEVKTTAGKKNDFRLRSPVSTAAVRGTIIEFSPDTVTLVEGTATAYNSILQKTTVAAGESVTYPTGFSRPDTETIKIRNTDVIPSTRNPGGASLGKIIRGRATVLITLEW